MEITVHESALKLLGKQALQLDIANEKAVSDQATIDQMFGVLTAVSQGAVKPEQLWVNVLARTWQIRELPKEEPKEPTQNGQRPQTDLIGVDN